MQMTTVYACVRILPEAFAGLLLHLHKYNGSGAKRKLSASCECGAMPIPRLSETARKKLWTYNQ
ncbi:MAG: hypothetical protein VB014_10965 [Acidaminococcaceae bacterium]|jgi:Phage-related protein|nr:hypothetical protein [Acidaminococcaceae bacterium]